MKEGRCGKCGNVVQKEGCPICRENEIIDHLPQEKDIVEFKEKVLIQMTKAVRLLTDDGYNQSITNPMHEIINELRKELNVQRVKTDTEEKIIKQPTKEVPDIRGVIENSDLAKHAEHGIAQLFIYPHPKCLKVEDIKPQRDRELSKNIDTLIQEISALYKRGDR